jgi:hypothetical protein
MTSTMTGKERYEARQLDRCRKAYNRGRAAFDGHDIEAAIKQGLSDSFPWPGEILMVISSGAKEAIER